MAGHVPGDHGAGGNEGIASDRDAANDGRIGADGRATLDDRSLRLGPTRDEGARVTNVGEHRRGPNEHVVRQTTPS